MIFYSSSVKDSPYGPQLNITTNIPGVIFNPDSKNVRVVWNGKQAYVTKVQHPSTNKVESKLRRNGFSVISDWVMRDDGCYISAAVPSTFAAWRSIGLTPVSPFIVDQAVENLNGLVDISSHYAWNHPDGDT